MAIENYDLVCYSHLRWNFVFQRPQHLLTRFAKRMRVFYIEEPIYGNTDYCDVTQPDENIWIVVPHLIDTLTDQENNSRRKELLSNFFRK